ncbi:MAG: hypothetical protein IJL28_10455 [Prevotella sp.]|nr:hypothetical protein [Prevotella sp.]
MKKKELLKEEYDFILRLLGENDGIIEVKSDKVKNVFYDTDDQIKIEYTDGTIGLLNDVDVEMIQGITKKWAADNPTYMKTIVIEMLLGKPMPKLKHWAAKEK